MMPFPFGVDNRRCDHQGDAVDIGVAGAFGPFAGGPGLFIPVGNFAVVGKNGAHQVAVHQPPAGVFQTADIGIRDSLAKGLCGQE